MTNFKPLYCQQSVLLLRHPKPQVPEGVCYGQLDLPLHHSLNFTDDADLRLLRKHLQRYQVHSSPLQRCTLLAQFLAEDGSRPIDIHPAWQELNFGDWEGKAWSNIEPSAIDNWQQNLAEFVPPSGESAQQMQTRVLSAWRQLLQIRSEPLLLVSHLGVIRMILAELLSAPFSAQLRLKVEYQHGVLLTRSWLAETIEATPIMDSEVWQIEAINLSPKALVERL